MIRQAESTAHPRHTGPRRQCPHCDCTARTYDPRCPVCDRWYREPLLHRLMRRLGRRTGY